MNAADIREGELLRCIAHLELDLKTACAYGAEIQAKANAYPRLVAALQSAEFRLKCISDLIDGQTDQKLDGERSRYNYKAAALQMNEEALAEREDIRALLREFGEL